MAEEGVQLANDAIAQALLSVKYAEDEAKRWNELFLANFGNLNISFFERERDKARTELDKARTELDMARTELDKANERLKEAREYYLQVSQQAQQSTKEMLVKEFTYGKVNVLLG